VEFKDYLTSKFSKGMSFKNYGKLNGNWSIDHIKPCASFDLRDIRQQKECFYYTNLQPLWNEEQFHKNSLHNGQYIRIRRK
jgi:hypothetical protein